MRVLTVQHDGKMPNLALIKLRAWHRLQGDQIVESNPDRAYISSIFSWNRAQALGVGAMYPGAEIHYGGTGIDLKKALPPEVENVEVDWAAEGMDYAIGYTTRGCNWRCPFCIVPEKEGHIQDWHTLEHITQGLRRVILLDNNLLASPSAEATLAELRDGGYAVSFTQGLDLRLLSHRTGALLADVNYRNYRFKGRALYFAWDMMGNEDGVRRGLSLLLDAGVPPGNIVVHLLTNYNTTTEQDLYRANVLWGEYRVLPFVMGYDLRTAPQEKRDFARWVNHKAIFKSVAWSDYRKPPRPGGKP